MTSYPEKKFAASTIEVNYAEGPNNGPPMVLIHGLGGRWPNWEPVMDQFSADWHVYALDLRGHGDSGRTPDEYEFNHYPNEVIEFLQKVVKEPAFLVGHSLGGVTTAGVSARNSDLVTAAALEDPPLYIREWFDESGFAPVFKSILEIRNKNLDVNKTAVELRRIDSESSDEAIHMRAIAVTKADPGIWEAVLSGRSSENWKPDDVLSSNPVPTLLMQANPDLGGALRDVEADRTNELLERGRYVKWDDAGHGMHNEHPERFVQLVNAFFKQVLRRQSQS
ncbi:alpha/beta fold hydrolase [Candidatus Lucifugimonas marina]|jgi:pimeloyl-ACP methyl ester carboxylesterase|uniref:Alpha/beta fold hydrolase n=1 Tax=Candidatus Lucifugimonas marina TaxID=3038979 RepID=A0AAJ5ZE71_9CHLR|nr:alpha/beta fold hydrolase [SAR202 cluster bacterium JH702]MDG0869770.1 alpha/beta fold hydrolase [SAR202 cluster bacterium JH639]WFG34497.1 alpha/beta fold hydrolase [SAR202 cluster bacterium JH545]WFG38426.1 alpha/beta fold hydrolase [SAR202 cluster bacterium JH1073]